MPKYKYQAVTENGKKVRGMMIANDEADLYAKLKTEGRFLTSVQEQVDKHHMPILKARQVSDFCREIGTFLGAGVPLARALGIIAEDEGLKPKERMIYGEVLRVIRQGTALSEALEEQGSFPAMMVQMFRAAETAGDLDQTAQRMAVHYDKEHRLNSKFKSSTTYPKFLCGMMVAVVAILIGYILPQFEPLFSMMEELPLPTRILYGITSFVSKCWIGLSIGGIAAIFLIRRICRIPAIHLQIDKLKLHIPLIGKQLKIIYTARFARALCSLYSAGIPIVTGIQIARKSIGNDWIDKQFGVVSASLRSGDNLSDAVGLINGFIKKLTRSIKVGEETGSLDTMLTSTADALEYESEMALNRMVSYLEPALIVVMAVIVGFIMIAVMMPIYASYSVISGSAYY